MTNVQGTRTVYHYTDRKGKEGIERTRTIETSGSGGKQGKINRFLASLLIIIYVRRRLSGCFCSCFGVYLFVHVVFVVVVVVAVVVVVIVVICSIFLSSFDTFYGKAY